jgi:transposase
MGTSNSKKLEIKKRRRRVAELYLRGWSQREIADDIDMSVATVNRDLSAIQEQWTESALIDMDVAMARQLARLQKLEDEAWEAWHKSKEDKTIEKKKRRERIASGDGENRPSEIEMRETTKSRYGNTAILDRIMRIVDRRTELLGLDEYDPSVEADRIEPLVDAIEATADDDLDERFADEDIR